MYHDIKVILKILVRDQQTSKLDFRLGKKKSLLLPLRSECIWGIPKLKCYESSSCAVCAVASEHQGREQDACNCGISFFHYVVWIGSSFIVVWSLDS